MQTLTIEAPSVAAFVHALAALDHDTRAYVVATENGTPWAQVDVSPLTDSHCSAFPNYIGAGRGDTRKRGESGVMWTTRDTSPLSVVIQRALRMARA